MSLKVRKTLRALTHELPLLPIAAHLSGNAWKISRPSGLLWVVMVTRGLMPVGFYVPFGKIQKDCGGTGHLYHCGNDRREGM